MLDFITRLPRPGGTKAEAFTWAATVASFGAGLFLIALSSSTGRGIWCNYLEVEGRLGSVRVMLMRPFDLALRLKFNGSDQFPYISIYVCKKGAIELKSELGPLSLDHRYDISISISGIIYYIFSI